MLGDLFMPSCEIPEAPKQGFFKNLFSGSGSVLDREELCKYCLLVLQHWHLLPSNNEMFHRMQYILFNYIIIVFVPDKAWNVERLNNLILNITSRLLQLFNP